MNLRAIYEIYKEHIDENPTKSKKQRKKEVRGQIESIVSDAEVSAVQTHYPVDHASPPTSLSTDNEDEGIVAEDQALQPVKMKSIESNLNEIALDENRIIHPNANLSGLYEFVPATKIKGNRYCKNLEIQMLDVETSL